MPSAQQLHRHFYCPLNQQEKKILKKPQAGTVNLYLKKNSHLMIKYWVLAQALILGWAEASAFVPNMLSETPSYFLDAFLISGGSYISTANVYVTNNKHSISSPVELFHSAYLEVQFCCLHFNHIFQQHSTLCNRPFCFMKDKNHCIFHFIF